MSIRKILSIAAGLVVLASTAGLVAGPREAFLVSTTWLAQHLGDADLVLLHIGEKPEYDSHHIPGARYVALPDLSAPGEGSNGLTLEMSPPETLRSQLAALGISDNSHVVVYYGKDWVSPSTRVVITLLFAGLQNISLLDGGMGAWQKDGNQVTDVVPVPRTGTLAPLKIKPLVVDAEFVRSHVTMPAFAVVDARAASFYDGTQEGGPKDHRKAGHIAGARSVPFTEVSTSDLKLKSPEELAAVFSKAGVQPGDTVVTYCHIGQQATATLFAALTLGHPVLLYDGSFEDWARRDLPVDNPSKKASK
jgi:thiosulfate/3-mercaptopyruvate sulfurtransferase